ncbi:UNVERIFIED_CONTAM: hypothetical protein GTU68_051198 [Idotea baltica]|nr:hypothetical protein [Idotea baltica]
MKIPPAKGRLLISKPFLKDPNFWRSVVLLAEHGDEGSVGFVLNRKLDYSLNDLLGDFPPFNAPVYLGGPVGTDTLHFFHSIESMANKEYEVLPGIYQGTNFEDLKVLVMQGIVSPDEVRFFVGYSGWSAGQLEEELKGKTWIVADPPEEFSFNIPADKLWQSVLQSMGGKYRVISHYPEDPVMN